MICFFIVRFLKTVRVDTSNPRLGLTGDFQEGMFVSISLFIYIYFLFLCIFPEACLGEYSSGALS